MLITELEVIKLRVNDVVTTSGNEESELEPELV